MRERVALKRKRAEDPEQPGSADEVEAKELAALQERIFDQCVEARLKLEKEGKCRCCYASCSKLFKGLDFLTKHMHLKHEDFSHEELLRAAEPYLRRRFEAEPIKSRPLPPVEVDYNGHTELRSVRFIAGKNLPGQLSNTIINNNTNTRRGGDAVNRGGNKRGQDDRDRRAPPTQKMQYVEPRSEDNHARKISSYIDVDAPKVKILLQMSFVYRLCLLYLCTHNLSQSIGQLHCAGLRIMPIVSLYSCAHYLLQMWKSMWSTLGCTRFECGQF